MADVMTLFDDYAARYARGERPSVREYLTRAGGGADELAALIDGYLARAPAREPAAEDVALMRARLAGEPPLLAARLQRRKRVDEVVDGLIGVLGLDRAKRAKVKRYYQQLEGAVLDPAGVSDRVWGALEQLLGFRRDRLTMRRPARLETHAAYLRTDALAEAAGMPMAPAPAETSDEDEIDRLFRGGP